jgi:pimeloyl-ACP methyl ester carboxylesterase
MAHFVFVHGAWHGAWCWQRVISALQSLGHEVVSLDLPGHGDDQTPVAQVSLMLHAQRICECLKQLPEPAVLVGHSMGGIAISQAAELCPERVSLLIYLAAYLVPNGQSLNQCAKSDSESALPPHLRIIKDEGIMRVDDSGLKDIIYGGLNDDDWYFVKSRIRPEPIAPHFAALELSESRFGTITRAYILCLRDQVIGAGLYTRMLNELPCHSMVTMDTAHAPLFTAPMETAANLDRLVKMPI